MSKASDLLHTVTLTQLREAAAIGTPLRNDPTIGRICRQSSRSGQTVVSYWFDDGSRIWHWGTGGAVTLRCAPAFTESDLANMDATCAAEHRDMINELR